MGTLLWGRMGAAEDGLTRGPWQEPEHLVCHTGDGRTGLYSAIGKGWGGGDRSTQGPRP